MVVYNPFCVPREPGVVAHGGAILRLVRFLLETFAQYSLLYLIGGYIANFAEGRNGTNALYLLFIFRRLFSRRPAFFPPARFFRFGGGAETPVEAVSSAGVPCAWPSSWPRGARYGLRLGV